MREIKFRAWDKEAEIMDDEIIDFYIPRYAMQNEIIIRPYEILMQYTGLKDKNGVEIYEGDIVQIGVLKEYDFISFERGSFIYSRLTEEHGEMKPLFDYRYTDEQDMVFCKVIGNIYENKELLCDQNNN